MKHKVEFIESYIKIGNDYKWNDNHGELIRCMDCKYWQDNNGGYPHDDCKWNANETPDPDDYCSGTERKEE